MVSATADKRLCRWLALLLLIGCSPATDHGLDNTTVSIVIPYRAGGGFDRTVRAFAPHFARHLGNGVTVLPTNTPGAGGRRGAAMVYRAKPDGTTLGIYNLPGFVLPEILGQKVDYDLRKLSWIGRLEWQPYVLLVAATSDIDDLNDLQALADISFLSTGYGSSVLAASQIVAEQLQLADSAPKYLAGYAGTADYLVGLIRGDGNVALAPVSSALNYIESGDLRPLVVAGAESSLPGVPTFGAAGYPDLAMLGVQRSIAGPPGMKVARLQELRAAFDLTVSDQRFIAAAGKAKIDLSPLDGGGTAEEVEKSFTFYEAFKTNLRNPNTF